MKTCIHLNDLVKTERELIERHIDEHKWFHHIPNKEDGIRDFIQEYAWLMKEMFCEYVCKRDCIHKEYKRNEEEQYLFPDFVEKDNKEDCVGL